MPRHFAMSLLGAIAAASLPVSALAHPASEHSAEDWRAAATAIEQVMREHHFDPAVERDPAFLAIEAEMRALAETAETREAFVEGFNRRWSEGPFSHVRLSTARASALETAIYLDNLRVGGEPVRLEWRGKIAVLTVDTMMGLNTIEMIDAAFAEIVEREAERLIIDLRENSGGAFAVRPLIAHVIDEPVDGGVFVSRRWTGANEGYPAREAVEAIAPWQGWSIRAFWDDLRTEPFIRMQIAPAEPHFAGPVAVLISGKTASAAELATDALAASGRAVIVGERTAGEMLSQTFFDLPGGLQIALPIGDYYAWRSGRIEGQGVAPDIAVPAEEALETALSLDGR